MVNEKFTSDQHRVEWPVWRWTVLDPPLWIGLSVVLNDVFVAGLPGLVDLSVHPQWSRSLQYARASVCRSRAFGPCFLFLKSLSAKCPVLPFYFRKLCQYPTWTIFFELVYVLNQCVVFIAKWHVTLPDYCHSIQIITYTNMLCFYLQTSETYLKLQ